MTEKNVIQIDKADKHPLDARTIQRQLSQILASKEFHATERQREFLKFVVAETVAGRSDEIKGYAVATQVFGRNEDFDQATDPIVSIQANQLRRALERYYLVTGQNNPVRIDIPKGTYVPTFHGQIRVEPYETGVSSRIADISFEASWPLLLVRQFQNLSGDPEQDYLGIGLATDLAVELSRYPDILVLVDSQEGSV